jgi:hypothetical protein
MNQSALRLFVRSLIMEAKEKKAEKEPKKTMKKEEKAPKSSGKLVDLKKELAALKQMRDELQMAKFAEKTASTEVEFADLKKFATELDKIKAGGIKLEQEIDDKIDELEARISDEKNKIKEMMGLVPETKGKKKIVDEKKTEEINELFGDVSTKLGAFIAGADPKLYKQCKEEGKSVNKITMYDGVRMTEMEACIKEKGGTTSATSYKGAPGFTGNLEEKVDEAKKMTPAQKDKKEDIVKGMKKSGGFGKSKEEKSKMYATATKLATKKK